MDFESILKVYKNNTCIISVEQFPDGHCGNIRIAAGNRAHCEDMLNTMHRPFIPDSPYEEYLPQNKNFEDSCIRCAFGGQPLHSYVSLPRMGLWLNMFLLPLESDRENTGYCIYSYDVATDEDSEQRVSLAADTSSAVLKTCFKLRGSENIRQTFNEVISDIRNICDSDECCILLVDRSARTCTALCEAIRPGSEVPSIYTAIENGFYDITETWDDTISDTTCVIIKDTGDMEWLGTINPVWRDSLVGSKVGTLVFFPLDYNNERIGYIWASNFNTENAFKIKEILELATFFIASEIANFQLLSKLEIMSSRDLLTGVMNRNEMNDYVERLAEGRCSGSVGVIFADVNGLKEANDTKGHNAGDELLINIASAMKNVFDLHEIFRAGGDEFVIILTGITEDMLQEKLELLRKESENFPGLSFSVGTAYDESAANVRSALRFADEKMYLDKKRYYHTKKI